MGLKFEVSVVEDIVGRVLGVRAGLPLLQFTLLKLWQNRDHNRVTGEAYRRVGHPLQALQRSADALHAGLPEEEKELRGASSSSWCGRWTPTAVRLLAVACQWTGCIPAMLLACG